MNLVFRIVLSEVEDHHDSLMLFQALSFLVKTLLSSPQLSDIFTKIVCLAVTQTWK